MKLSTFLIVVTSLSLALLATGCAGNPNKAEKVDTQIEHNAPVNSETQVGVKDGNLIVQKKVLMHEEVRRLQNEVYSLEDRVYGNRQYGSLGLYGVLRQCRAEIADKKNGGDGKLIWTEPVDRVTANEDEYKIGIDEKDKIVGLKEEYLKDRIERFRGYRNVLEKRQDEYETKVEICQAELKSKKYSAKKGTDPEEVK